MGCQDSRSTSIRPYQRGAQRKRRNSMPTTTKTIVLPMEFYAATIIKNFRRHLIGNHVAGDTRGIDATLFKRFMSPTSGAIYVLETEYNNTTVVSTGLRLEMYAAKAFEREKMLLAIKKEQPNASSERKKVNILVNGLLLPEFNPIKVLIGISPSNLRFEDTLKQLTDFAETVKLLHLTR